jgi:hypothetical protein
VASQVALGFLVVAALVLALFFLVRSMNKQLATVGGTPHVRAGAAAGGATRPGASPDQPEHVHNSPEYLRDHPDQRY